jgi:hypothetical protein
VRRLLLGVAVASLLLAAGCSEAEPNAGPNATTSTEPDGDAATTTTGFGDEPAVTTSTEAEAAAAIVLRGDGLGVTELGAAPGDAIAAVTAALGEPTRDTGWEPSFSEYGTCPGEQIRGVEWDHLVLLFTDGTTDRGSGEHLFAWRLTGAPPALGTATGLGYQATVTDAEELHPGAITVFPAEDPFPGYLEIAADGGTITAYLDGDVITNLEAGTACGE